MHLGAREYDPGIARWLSPDPVPGAGYPTQGWNPYSYANNNPLRFTDPSGMCFLGCFWKPIFHEVGHLYRGIGGLFRDAPVLGDLIVIGSGFLCGGCDWWAVGLIDAGAAGFVAGTASGKAGLGIRAALIAFAEAGAFHEVGDLTDGHFGTGYGGVNAAGEGLNNAGETMGAWAQNNPDEFLENVAGHAAVGALAAAASGGSAGSGALAAGFSDFAGGELAEHGVDETVYSSAVLGGLGSVLGGGKFENGAITGAFGYLFNDLAHAEVEAHVPSFLQSFVCGNFRICSASYSVGVAVSYPGYTDAPYDAAVTTSSGVEGGVDITSRAPPSSWSKWSPAIFDISGGKDYGDFSNFSGKSYSLGGNFGIVGVGEVFTPGLRPYGDYFRLGGWGLGNHPACQRPALGH